MEDLMAAQVLKEVGRLSAANHPENMPAPAPQPRSILAPTIGVCALSGVVGAVFGVMGLHSAIQAGWAEFFSVFLLILTGVGILTGWIGALFCMFREDPGS